MMPNPFFGAFGGNGLGQMVQQIKANPMQFLSRGRFQIPSNILSDPNAIVQHLVSSGQISQQQLNSAYRQMQMMGKK